MNKFLTLSMCIASILILTLTGCSIGTMKSKEQRLNELVNSINPFDFGDEFLQDMTISKDLDSSESAANKNIFDTRIQTDALSSNNKNGLQLKDNTSTLSPDSTVDRFGYRIQIGAFEYKENAEKLKNFARSKTDLPIYVVYIAPFYRVRIGDFTEKSEAEKCVKFLKDKGFSDARYIQTSIHSNKRKVNH